MNRYEPTQVLSITELTRRLKQLVEGQFPLVWAVGEISNFRPAASGHWYLTLKDQGAQIRCAMFRGQNRFLKFRPEDGMEAVVRGRLTVYEPRGDYQIIAEHMEPRGVGALQVAFEQLRARLEAEGLFAPARKRPLPFLPRRIGVVTSLTGAVIRDICHVAFRRFPGAHLLIHPVRVQGEHAAGEIARALDAFGRRGDVDVIIVARGGGSIEDLWAFNEEVVARAIASSPIPVISAVGHESDFTIADFAADVRAPTPSAAAEIALPVRAELYSRIESLQARLAHSAAAVAARQRERVRDLSQTLEDPRLALGGIRRRLDEAEEILRVGVLLPLEEGRRGAESLRARLWAHNPRAKAQALRASTEALGLALRIAAPRRHQRVREHLQALSGLLDALSPLAVLARGYAVAELSGGAVLRSARQAPVGSRVSVRLHQGRLETKVLKSSG